MFRNILDRTADMWDCVVIYVYTLILSTTNIYCSHGLSKYNMILDLAEFSSMLTNTNLFSTLGLLFCHLILMNEILRREHETLRKNRIHTEVNHGMNTLLPGYFVLSSQPIKGSRFFYY
jgi:hypothetical protein